MVFRQGHGLLIARKWVVTAAVAMFVGGKGQSASAPHRGVLRRAYNSIRAPTIAMSGIDSIRFDPPAQGLPLEGALGSGDSGGPLVVRKQDAWRLIGLGS